jgi:hypothetical protein
MKITKRQLRRLIREEYDAYSTESIRERGDTMEMAQEVGEIMNSMGPGALSGKEAYDMIRDAINAADDPGYFWSMMLSQGGPIGEAIQGLMDTADEDYDPDVPGG